jgi:hypothetical protein
MNIKNSLLAFSFLLTSSHAGAVVRPMYPGGGEILDSACGHLNRSVQLCIARAQNSGESYIALKHFMKNKTYIPVTATKQTAAGATTIIYSGRAAVEQDDGTLVESKYEVKYTQVTRPGVPGKATLSVNGVKDGPAIEMQRIAYPQ